MKPSKSNRLALISLGSILFCQTAGAATITKANNTTQLNNNGSWVGNVQPGAADIALWDSTVTTATAANNFFNANGTPVWGQVKITNPGANIFISDNGNHQLKLDGVSDGTNVVGLDMSAATVDLRIGATVILNNPQHFKVAADRTVYFHSSITNAERLTFSGDGNLGTYNAITLTTAQPYTGKTKVLSNTLTLSGGGQLTATSGVEISGGTLVVGATGTGVADRINPASTLTMGGGNGPGTFTLTAGATPVNSQTFSGLIVDKGLSAINNANTNGPSALTFSSTYTKLPGGFLNLSANSLNFAAAPTGAGVIGTGGNEILIGATIADIDFVKAAAGALAPATYSTDIFGPGLNTNLTVSGTFPDVTAQSLRLAGQGNPTYTLSGTNTIESGMIVISSNGTANLKGGTLQAGAGHNITVYSASGKNMLLGSVITDNGAASGFEKYGAGTVNLAGDNTFTGPVYLQGGFIELQNPNALGSASATTVLNVTGTTTLRSGNVLANNVNTVANVVISRPIILATGQGLTYDTNGAGNTVTLSGPLQTTPWALGNVSHGGTATLTKSGEGKMIFSGTTTGVSNLNLGLNVTGGKLDITGNFTGASPAFAINGRNMSTSPVGSTVPEINVLPGGTLYNTKDWNIGQTNSSININMQENSTAAAGRLYVGKGSGAVVNFNQNGGTMAAGNVGLNSDSYTGDFTGIYNLNGGTLTSQNVIAGNGGVMNLNGGLLKLSGGGAFTPAGSSPNINYGKVYVKAGGARIESLGSATAITNVNLPLEHDPALTTADGGLIKTGPGILSINAPSTYNGGTRVQAGTLSIGTGPGYAPAIATTGKLGPGRISVEGGVLTLGVNDAINDSSVLSFSGTTPPVINLNAATPEVLGTVVDGDDPTKLIGAGTYTATDLNTFFGKTVFAGTGSVTISAPIVDGYGAWATDNGLTSANNGKDFDADDDGYSNLLEYVTGGDPLDGNNRGVNVMKVQDVSGSQALTLTASIRSEAVFTAGPSGTLVASVGGSTYHIEASTNLVNWDKQVTEITPILGDVPVTPPAGTVYHTFRTQGPVSTTPKEFIRLRVTTP